MIPPHCNRLATHGGEIVTLIDPDFDASVLLVNLIGKVAGLGTADGAAKMNDGYVPVIIPNVELPPTMLFTVTVTSVLVVPVTLRVMGRVWVAMIVGGLVGLVILTATESGVDGPTNSISG